VNQHGVNLSLKEKTELFWFLQLQFLEMNQWHLRTSFWAIQSLPVYKPNKITYKLKNKVDGTYQYDEETRQCLATHLAIQLSGVEE
jgi:hypothetical protein